MTDDIWNTLLAQIEYFSLPFPRAALAYANAHRDEVAPHLVAALAHMAADPSMAEDPDYMLHLYAMHLLAAWRDTRAYAPMVALGHHDEDTVELMMGDTVTESYGRCLASVCDGDLQPLKTLFEDTQACHWARTAALDALVLRVLEGDDARDALVQYLMERGDAEAQRSRLAKPQSPPKSPSKSIPQIMEPNVLDHIAWAATDIAAVEMLERIEQWFDEQLLDPMCSSKMETLQEIAKPFGARKSLPIGIGKGYVRDAEEEMAWWATFQPEPAKKPKLKPLLRAAQGQRKIGRNDPCPCGSGKKYKKCHGAVDPPPLSPVA